MKRFLRLNLPFVLIALTSAAYLVWRLVEFALRPEDIALDGWFWLSILAALAGAFCCMISVSSAKSWYERCHFPCPRCGRHMGYIDTIDKIAPPGSRHYRPQYPESPAYQTNTFEKFHCRHCGCDEYKHFRWVNPTAL